VKAESKHHKLLESKRKLRTAEECHHAVAIDDESFEFFQSFCEIVKGLGVDAVAVAGMGVDLDFLKVFVEFKQIEEIPHARDKLARDGDGEGFEVWQCDRMDLELTKELDVRDCEVLEIVLVFKQDFE
jgi:hypothetical protein